MFIVLVFIPKYTVNLYNLVLFCNASSSACVKALAPANTLVDLHSIPQQWSGHRGRVLLHWTSALVSLVSCRKKTNIEDHRSEERTGIQRRQMEATTLQKSDAKASPAACHWKRARRNLGFKKSVIGICRSWTAQVTRTNQSSWNLF